MEWQPVTGSQHAVFQINLQGSHHTEGDPHLLKLGKLSLDRLNPAQTCCLCFPRLRKIATMRLGSSMLARMIRSPCCWTSQASAASMLQHSYLTGTLRWKSLDMWSGLRWVIAALQPQLACTTAGSPAAAGPTCVAVLCIIAARFRLQTSDSPAAGGPTCVTVLVRLMAPLLVPPDEVIHAEAAHHRRRHDCSSSAGIVKHRRATAIWSWQLLLPPCML